MININGREYKRIINTINYYKQLRNKVPELIQDFFDTEIVLKKLYFIKNNVIINKINK